MLKKHFFFVTKDLAKSASAFISGKSVHPGIMFAIKAKT